MPRLLFACLLIVACLTHRATAEEKSTSATVDTSKAAERLPGHSEHGEAFDEGPRQSAYLMGGTGNVHLAVTTNSAEAQKYFDQGVGQLHGFWYFEAERSFRQAATLDPQCAMAYWGMAMANHENEARAKQFIEKAVERKANASAREVLWIDALAAFHAAGKKDDKARRREYVRALERIVHEYPEEVEAKAFLVSLVWYNMDKRDMPIGSHQALDTILNEVFAVQPMHPAHHYRIHLWDKEKADRALGSAARCGASAPTIAHMWHMPGHIYSGLHRYSDAAWHHEASARVDHAHMIRDHVLPDQIHNYAHNNEWLVRDLSQIGRVHDAVALAKNMIELPRHPKFNTLSKNSSAKYGRLRLFDVLESYELWDALIALSDTIYLDATDIPAEKIKRLRAIGVAHAGRSDRDACKAQVAALDEMLVKVKADQQAAADGAESKARKEKKPDAQVAKAKDRAMQRLAGQIRQLEQAIADLNGRLALANGEYDRADAEFEKAGDLSKEFIARVALWRGDTSKAEQLAREAVEATAGEVRPLANYVDILLRCGKKDDAKREFTKLREMASHIDLDVPVFQRLAGFANELELADDWRAAAPVAADFGERPPLDTLGPMHWHPWTAESWSLAMPDGRRVSLSDYRGKPVVVVFYLGFGCAHCVAQLQALKPMEDKFTEAGLELVAISSETSDELREALANRDVSDATFWFSIVSDSPLDVFRRYRAFDDFEKVPLHATVMIDGQGHVRWQDIGSEPFTDFDFLLEEAKRQLEIEPRE